MENTQNFTKKKKKKQTVKNPENERIDFKLGVPDTLYRQAGGRCSVPRCKNPTMGPYYERDGAVNMGVACHIYSAAENGPRGRGGNDADFISSEQNGIWCCQYHSSLIDKSKGSDYPAAVLFAWKALAEARVLKQMNDIPSPLGWVESIEFIEFPVLESLPKVTLSRFTLLWGENHRGKTSLLDAAASVSRSRYAERFSGTQIKNAKGVYEPAKFCAKVTYSTVDSLSKELNLEIVGLELTRRDGLVPCLLPPGDLEVIYCSESERRKLDSEDDVDFMMRVLSVDKSAFYALAKIGVNTLIPGEIKIQQAEEEDASGVSNLMYKANGKPHFEVLFKIAPRTFFVPYELLSSSEQGRLILDLQITKAREICKQRLTLLLIESLSINFDAESFETLLKQLAKEEFQVVVSLPPYLEHKLLQNDTGPYTLQTYGYLDSWHLAIIGEEG